MAALRICMHIRKSIKQQQHLHYPHIMDEEEPLEGSLGSSYLRAPYKKMGALFSRFVRKLSDDVQLTKRMEYLEEQLNKEICSLVAGGMSVAYIIGIGSSCQSSVIQGS
jgi:hypothetical protein